MFLSTELFIHLWKEGERRRSVTRMKRSIFLFFSPPFPFPRHIILYSSFFFFIPRDPCNMSQKGINFQGNLFFLQKNIGCGINKPMKLLSMYQMSLGAMKNWGAISNLGMWIYSALNLSWETVFRLYHKLFPAAFRELRTRCTCFIKTYIS